MPTFGVGTSPMQVVGYGTTNVGLAVQNTGPESVYLAGDSGVSTTSYDYKIDPGGDWNWPASRALFVVSKLGTGLISYGTAGNVALNSGSTNVSGTVNIAGTVPISGPVTVTGSVALNAGSQVAILGGTTINGSVALAAGSAVTISGPVSIPGGVNVTNSTLNIVGAVNTTQSTTALANWTTTLAAGNTVILPITSMANLQSIVVTVGNTANTSGATAFVNGIILDWFNTAGQVLSTETFYYSQTGISNYISTVKGVSLRVTFSMSTLNTYSILPIVVLGSTLLLAETYQNTPGNTARFLNCTDTNSQLLIAAKILVIECSIPANTTGTVQIPSIAKSGTLTMLSSGALSVRIVMNSINSSFGALILAQQGSGNLTSYPVVMPVIPLSLSLVNANATAVTLSMSIVFTR